MGFHYKLYADGMELEYGKQANLSGIGFDEISNTVR